MTHSEAITEMFESYERMALATLAGVATDPGQAVRKLMEQDEMAHTAAWLPPRPARVSEMKTSLGTVRFLEVRGMPPNVVGFLGDKIAD